MAYTAAEAKRLGLKVDRVVHRYVPPKELAPGWRLACSIEIPESSISTKSVPAEPGVQWWPYPGKGFALMFNLYLTATDDADRAGLPMISAGFAGSFFAAGGGSGFLNADEEDVIGGHEALIQNARDELYRNQVALGEDTDQDNFTWGLATNNEIEVPRLLDIGNLERLRDYSC